MSFKLEKNGLEPAPLSHPPQYPKSGLHPSSNIEESLRKRHGPIQRVILFCYLPQGLHEYLIPVDLSALWRRHLVWAKKDGDDLLRIVTTRFTTTTVFLSLLVSAELGVFFSPSNIVEEVRQALLNDETGSLSFWIGIVLSLSILVSMTALVANFTAWSIFNVLSKENSAILLRSSIGLYAAQLPSRLVISSMYLFFVWVAMFWWKALPRRSAIILTLLAGFLVIHVASTFSAVGRIIMATSAMGPTRILPKNEEEKLLPSELTDVLINEAFFARRANISVTKQYRMNREDSARDMASMTHEDLLRRRHPDVELGQASGN